MMLELHCVCVRCGFHFPTLKVLPLTCMFPALSFTDRSISSGTWAKGVFNHCVRSYLRGNNLAKLICTRIILWNLRLQVCLIFFSLKFCIRVTD